MVRGGFASGHLRHFLFELLAACSRFVALTASSLLHFLSRFAFSSCLAAWSQKRGIATAPRECVRSNNSRTSIAHDCGAELDPFRGSLLHLKARGLGNKERRESRGRRSGRLTETPSADAHIQDFCTRDYAADTCSHILTLTVRATRQAKRLAR